MNWLKKAQYTDKCDQPLLKTEQPEGAEDRWFQTWRKINEEIKPVKKGKE